jgi:carboxylesterase type B
MKLLYLFLVLLSFYKTCDSRTAENLKVEIDDGKIVGRYMTSISGKGIRSFLGIPYAAPPVGDLRFREPQKPIPWQDVLVAHSEPPLCTQTNIFDRREKRVVGQEDCLYLNVFTPVVCDFSYILEIFYVF